MVGASLELYIRKWPVTLDKCTMVRAQVGSLSDYQGKLAKPESPNRIFAMTYQNLHTHKSCNYISRHKHWHSEELMNFQ